MSIGLTTGSPLSIDIEYQVAYMDGGGWTVFRDGQIVSRNDALFYLVEIATKMAEQDARFLRKSTKVFIN